MGKSPKETGGPVVKTGPTSGNVRSRTQQGRWRKKRSDTGEFRERNGLNQTERGRIVSRLFWGTIIIFAILTIAIHLIGFFGGIAGVKKDPKVVEIGQTRLETLVSEAASKAMEENLEKLDPVMEEIYAPVYYAIPLYASFHYSVLGEYVELSEMVIKKSSTALEEKLFSGFDLRFKEAIAQFEKNFDVAYKRNIDAAIKKEMQEINSNTTLSTITKAILEDTRNRAVISKPIAAVVAQTGGIKILAQVMAKKIVAKAAAKATAKGIGKGGTILAGAGGGALFCSWAGPLSAVCAVGGATAAWLLTDAVIINLDEWWTREDFEKELENLIDEHKQKQLHLIQEKIKEKASKYDEAVKEIYDSFKLKDLKKE